jgi:hypothetical protein
VRDFKNIDRIFQENLKDFEVFPPNKAWSAIEKQLDTQPVKKPVPFWVKIASIAALFVLFFSVGTIYLLPEAKFSKNFLLNRIINSDSISDNNSEKPENKEVKKINKDINENKQKLTNNSKDTKLTSTEFENENISFEESATSKKQLTKFLLTDNSEFPVKKTQKNNANIKSTKFTIATIFAPIYINSLGGGSSVDSQFRDNSTSGNSSYSYGVKFAYQLNSKFSVQSGVNLINLGITTNDIYINSSVAILGFSNLSANPLVARNEVINKNNSLNLNKGSLNQVFGYIEIPVELKYSVTDGKFGVNLVGGFSTLLLNKDEVFIETNDFSQSLGSSNNLRSVNFSGNIGVDIDYLIHKNLYINVSPMFKMQTNTFSKNSGSIQPYYLGVYTGLNYKF